MPKEKTYLKKIEKFRPADFKEKQKEFFTKLYKAQSNTLLMLVEQEERKQKENNESPEETQKRRIKERIESVNDSIGLKICYASLNQSLNRYITSVTNIKNLNEEDEKKLLEIKDQDTLKKVKEETLRIWEIRLHNLENSSDLLDFEQQCLLKKYKELEDKGIIKSDIRKIPELKEKSNKEKVLNKENDPYLGLN